MKKFKILFLLMGLCYAAVSQNMSVQFKNYGNVNVDSKDGIIRNIFCMPDTIYGFTPMEAAIAFLNENSVELFGSNTPNLVFLSERKDPSGTQIRYHQNINGVFVIGGDVVIAINNENIITTVSNGYSTSLDNSYPSTIPTLDTVSAINIAKAHLGISNLSTLTERINLALSPKKQALIWQIYFSGVEIEPTIVELDAHAGSFYSVYNPLFSSHEGEGNVLAPDPATSYETTCWTTQCLNALNVDSVVVNKPIRNLNPPENGLFSLRGSRAFSYDETAKEPTPIFNYNYSSQKTKFRETNAYYHLDNLLTYIRELGFRPIWERMSIAADTVIVFKQHVHPTGSDGKNGWFNFLSREISLLGKGWDDQSVIAHEMGHALHDGMLLTKIFSEDVFGVLRCISEGFADYMGIRYRRHYNSSYRPNARFTFDNSTEPESILPPEICNFQNSWFPDSSAYISLRPYASALMDLHYNVATNPQEGLRLGLDTVLTLQLAGFGKTNWYDNLRTNLLNMYQADIDIYNGDHLQDLIEVYNSRKYFYSDSTQILEQDVTANQLLSSFFLLKDNRRVTNGAVLTIENNSRIVLGSDFTIENGATMVVGNNTRFFNRHLHHTIHVHGTLQIAGSTTLPVNIVVHNGGTLLINEGMAFAQQPGTVITVEQGGTVASSGVGTALNIASNWVIEPGAVFQNIGNTANKGLVLQPTANMDLANVTFLNTNVKGMGNFAFTNCLFTRSNLAATAEEILLEGCVFDRSVASLSVRSFNTTRADVLECLFLNGTENYALQLSGYQIYNVVNNRIEGNQGGGFNVSNCGLSKPEDHLIRGNTIRNNTGGEALRLYNTVAVLMGNTISGNSHGVGLYHNCLVESFGDEGSPQTISYNGTVQVRAVDNSFPWRFSFNRFEANLSDTLINCFYNTANGGIEENYLVEMNCWPYDFKPSAQFVPSDYFKWEPVWDCNSQIPLEPRNIAETLMIEGSTALNEDNTAFAKQRFEQVVAEFPQSPFALAALKSLRSVYHSAGYSPQAFKQYLESETALNSSPELQKIAGYLRAETDLFLANTQQALEFYQSVIANPLTPADEVYATIDAEYAGLDVGNKALTASSFTTMLAKVEKHNKNRNRLLDGLKATNAENMENQAMENATDFTLSPNPARGFVDIAFPGTINGNLTINLLSMDGRVVSSQTITVNPAEMKVHRINLPELNAGLYMVSMGLGNGHTLVRKLVVDTK